MQNASVVYDRFPSVFTQSDFETFSDDEIFSGGKMAAYQHHHTGFE
jgi:2-dehydro-3-deoxygluconokinase